MALTFPRDMIDGHAWRRGDFALMRRQELSRQAGGAAQGKDLGPTLWRAEFESRARTEAEADALLADFETLGGVLRTFYAWPVSRPHPAAYFDIAGYDLSSLTVHSIRADRMALRVTGFPASFAISAGDFLSVTTAAGGRELHRFATGGAASGAGLSPWLEISTALRSSVAVSDAVTMIKPAAEMRLEPGTLGKARGDGLSWHVAFSAVQVVT